MGCDIHSLSQRLINNQWIDINYKPFDERDYSLFSFLAGVRNKIGITPISKPKGLPKDLSEITNRVLEYEEWKYLHNHSYLTLKELIKFDYDKPLLIKDKALTIKEFKVVSHNHIGIQENSTSILTYRMFLSNTYLFKAIDELKEFKVDRILFAFDS